MRHLIVAASAFAGLAGMASAAQLQLAFPADPDLREALRNASLTATAVTDGTTETRDLVAAAQADYRRLLAVMFERGYFGPVISISVDGTEAAALPTVGLDGTVGTIVIAVQTGPAFLFGTATIAPLAPRTVLPEGFAAGQPAGTAILRETASAGTEAWRAIGHAKADLASQDIVADHATSRLDARLTLAPGPRLRYGPLTVTGATDVRASQVARLADLRPGRVYDPEEIAESARRLQRTGAFGSVSITEADAIGPGNTLPMTVAVVERLPRRFGIGGEIASDEGISASAYWLHRNFTGYADSLRIDASVGGVGSSSSNAGGGSGLDYGLTFAYNRPGTFTPKTDLFVNGGVERLDQPQYLSDRAFINAGALRIVSDEFQYSYGVGYEYSQISDDFGTREFSILSLPTQATYDRRDDKLNPKGGYYLDAALEPFVGFLTAGVGAKFDGDLRGYKGFGAEKGTVIAARVQVGNVFGPDIDEIPADMLYFSGGGGTVRGHDFQSLGVTLPGGETVGGKSFLGLSGEVRQQVTENIGLVGFVDFGLVGADSSYSSGESQTGAGVGLRYNTGIGPIRFDVGFPVSGADDAPALAVYIGIGQAF